MSGDVVRVVRMLAAASARPVGEQCQLWVDRRQFLKRRWEKIASDGTAFVFELESRLADGAVIHQTPAVDHVIRQLPEKVIAIPFLSAAHAAEVAWKIGNLHLPAEMGEDTLRVLHDPLAGKLLAQEGWAYEEPTVVFNPLRAVPHQAGPGPAAGGS